MTNSTSSSLLNTTTTETQEIKPQSWWRIGIPLLFQVTLVLAGPAPSFYTLTTGKTVVIKTIPVDPYDVLRGYSQTLSYDISNLETFKSLPKDPINQTDSKIKPVYILLKAPQNPTATPPQPWTPVGIYLNPPPVGDNQIMIQGTIQEGRIEYGLETYYMPEDQINQINQDFAQAQWGQNRKPILAEIKVDSQGRSVLVSLWLDNHNYKF